MVERLRGNEGARCRTRTPASSRELDTSAGAADGAEGTSAELAALREERELIRSRVDEMLAADRSR